MKIFPYRIVAIPFLSIICLISFHFVSELKAAEYLIYFPGKTSQLNQKDRARRMRRIETSFPAESNVIHRFSQTLSWLVAYPKGQRKLVRHLRRQSGRGSGVDFQEVVVEKDELWFANSHSHADQREAGGTFNSKQWALSNANGPDMEVERAWEYTRGNTSVVVAVIDSGLDFKNKEFRDSLYQNPAEIPGNGKDDDGNGYVDDISGWDFIDDDNDPEDDNNHGTKVASLIAARGRRMHGIAPKVKILPLKFLNARGTGKTSNAIKAMEYTLKMGVPIVNNSWGSNKLSQVLKATMERAGELGQLIVVASGNQGRNIDLSPRYPSSFRLGHMISVASVDDQGRLASSSNYGRKTVDVAAPGVRIYTAKRSGAYAYSTGTSYAAPLVAGAAALLLSYSPGLSSLQIKQLLTANAMELKSLAGKVKAKGMVSAGAALESYDRDPPENLPFDFKAFSVHTKLTSERRRSKKGHKIWITGPASYYHLVKKTYYKYKRKENARFCSRETSTDSAHSFESTLWTTFKSPSGEVAVKLKDGRKFRQLF